MKSLISPLRRKIVVNSSLQLLVTGFFVGLSLLSAGFSVAMLKLFTQHVLVEISQLSEGPKAAMTQAILTHSDVVLWWMIAFSSFLALFAALAGVVILHRIAGPAIAIKNYLDEVKEGKKPARHPLRLRDGDFLQDVADNLAPIVDEYLDMRKKSKQNKTGPQ